MAELSLEDFFRSMFTHISGNELRTCIPAKVIKVNTFETEQTVDVKPLINKTYDDGVIMSLPNVLAVPVIFPSAGGGALTFPIQVEDTVLLIFSMRSIDEWLESNVNEAGGIDLSTPVDNRTFHLTDAMAIPGLYTKNTHLKPNTTDVELKFLDKDKAQLVSIKMKPDGDLTIDTKKDLIATVGGVATLNAEGTITANSNTGDVILSNGAGKSLTLKQSGEVTHHSGAKITDGGDFVTAAGISLDGHVHSQPITGPDATVQGDTGVPK